VAKLRSVDQARRICASPTSCQRRPKPDPLSCKVAEVNLTHPGTFPSASWLRRAKLVATERRPHGPGRRGDVSKAFKAACAELGIRHVRTRPYTPKTNGKAERFVQTSLREWA
jgi:hypothetical protein